jgi:hypothetical protein
MTRGTAQHRVEQGHRWWVVVGIFFHIPLIFQVYLCSFSRMVADDYCSASAVINNGLVQAMQLHYIQWSGRFSASLLDALVGLASPFIVPFAPAIAIILWLVTITWALTRFGFSLFKAELSAVFIISVTLAWTLDPYDSLCWGQGMRSVIPPLILIPIILATHSWFLAFLVAFIAGGFSETFSVLQVTLLISLAVFWGERRKVLLAAFVGALLALIMVAIAPGNLVRVSLYPDPTLVSTIDLTNLVSISFLLRSLPAMLSVFLVSLSIDRISINKRFLAWSPLVFIGLIYSCIAPAAYAMSQPPPGRALIIPTFLAMVFAAFWGLSFRFRIPKSIVLPAASLVLLVLSINTLQSSYPLYTNFARMWEADALIIQSAKANGLETTAIKAPQRPTLFVDLNNPKNDWVLYCMNEFYKINITQLPLFRPEASIR